MRIFLLLLTVLFLFLNGCKQLAAENKANSDSQTVNINKAMTDSTPILNKSQFHVSKTELKDDWPFTIESGTLECKTQGTAKQVILLVENKTYAVNGAAKSAKLYLPINEIWSENPSIPGTKKDLGKIIDLGLNSCK